jgi:ferredoxin-NADP reductase
MSSPTLNALVHTMRYEADGIVSVEFRPATPAVDFPAFEAGSHIDLHLPNGLVRSYSLCNPSSDRQRYVVGVLNDRKSRGGSRYVHQQLRVGMTLPISAPRNNFKLQEGAGRSVLVAGGIGVTPIWSMLQRLVAIGQPVELVYCARTRKEAAFCDAIEALAKEKQVQLGWHFDDEKGAPPQLAELLAGKGADSHYYCCGPTPMLDAFEKSCEQLGYANAHIERFAAVHVEAPAPRRAMWSSARRAARASRCRRASRFSTA